MKISENRMVEIVGGSFQGTLKILTLKELCVVEHATQFLNLNTWTEVTADPMFSSFFNHIPAEPP